jgi:hypothetical protein
MGSLLARLWVVGLFLCLPMSLACSKEPCFPDSEGKEYRITVIERWDSNSRFPGGSPGTCPVGLDLESGSSLLVRVDRFNRGGTSCHCGMGSAIEAPDGWTWEGAEPAYCGANFFQLNTHGQNGACTGEVHISVHAPHVPTGVAVPGQPVAYLKRNFQEDTASCFTSGGFCSDRFVVEIEEL